MKHKIIYATIISLMLISQFIAAGTITDTYRSGDILTANKMNNIKTAVNDNDSNITNILSPIAIGSISAEGNVLRATQNVSSAMAPMSDNLYIISISGEFYNDDDFVTNVTAISRSPISCRTRSLNGNLLVDCFISSSSVTVPFHFVTYKLP